MRQFNDGNNFIRDLSIESKSLQINLHFFIPLLVKGCLNLGILSQQKPSAIKDSLKLK